MTNNGLFLHTFSRSRDIQVFVSITDDKSSQYKDKSENQEYLEKYWSDAAQTWHQ